MGGPVRVVHYLNQFFGQIGGEERAGVAPNLRPGPVGPGLALQAALGKEATICATVICGDNYLAEREREALAEIGRLVAQEKPDVLVAGPAFSSGRYGMACGAVGSFVARSLGIPAVTGLHPENPAVGMYRKRVFIVPTGPTAAKMVDAVRAIAPLALRLGRGEDPGAPEHGGYLPRGIRAHRWSDRSAAERAADLLLARLAGAPFESEVPLPTYDRVPPAGPVDPRAALVGIVVEGGLVPAGNPDRLESARTGRVGLYSLPAGDRMPAGQYEAVSGGFDRRHVGADPNRLLPLDALRRLQWSGAIGRLYPHYHTVVGNGADTATVDQSAREIVAALRDAGVQAAILTAT